jgi:CRISPR-associated endonuclease Csn1
VETSWIGKAVLEYLRFLKIPSHQVIGIKGQHTSLLRRQWGLNSVLRQDELELKNREDHRHHAIDALIVALTSRSRLQQISKGSWETNTGKKDEKGRVIFGRRFHGKALSDPWDGFRADVIRRAKEVIVSHRVSRKIRGSLHKESLYGAGLQKGKEIVIRKDVSGLTRRAISQIRDGTVRQAIQNRLIEFGLSLEGKAWSSAEKKLVAEALGDPKNPVVHKNGRPIRTVRVWEPRGIQFEIRGGGRARAIVVPETNHHIELLPLEEGTDPRLRSISNLEASRRIKNSEPLISEVPEPFMVLHSGEAILIQTDDGREEIWIYRTAAETSGQLFFCRHFDARSGGGTRVGCSPRVGGLWEKFQKGEVEKIDIDPIGEIRPTQK